GKQRCCCSTQLRSCVGRTVGLGTVVIAAVFILVGESEIRLGERKYPQRCRVRRHCDLAVQSAQHVGRYRGVKYLQFVAAWRNIRNVDLPSRIGNRIVWRGQSNYHRAHLRMNVAVDKGDAGFVELNEARSSALVESKIEPLSLKQ